MDSEHEVLSPLSSPNPGRTFECHRSHFSKDSVDSTEKMDGEGQDVMVLVLGTRIRDRTVAMVFLDSGRREIGINTFTDDGLFRTVERLFAQLGIQKCFLAKVMRPCPLASHPASLNDDPSE